MRIPSNVLALSPSLLLWTLTALLSYANSSSPNPRQPTPQLPFQVPQQPSHTRNGRSWFSRARNNVIQSIWHIPPNRALSGAVDRDSITARPPPTLLARYGGDLVLRFQINSIEEAEALTEAVNVLFLDVWEFNSEWVDIRLSKDVVSHRILLCPQQWLLTCVSPGPIIARPSPTLSSTCSHSLDA